MITSTANDKVKYVQSLGRRRVRRHEGRFVIEGQRLVDEARRAGVRLALLFYTDEVTATPAGRELLEALRGQAAQSFAVSEKVMKALSGTVTPQGILAVVDIPDLSPPADPWLMLVVDELRDPGNLGAILRSAEAVGVGQVLLSPGTVDVYNPKVVRGAMGAHFRLPIHADVTWLEIAETVGQRPVWLADAHGERVYYEVDWRRPSALIIGGEAHGASPGARALATGRVAIPMPGGAESLNATVAAGVILFEAVRQRALAGQERSKI